LYVLAPVEAPQLRFTLLLELAEATREAGAGGTEGGGGGGDRVVAVASGEFVLSPLLFTARTT